MAQLPAPSDPRRLHLEALFAELGPTTVALLLGNWLKKQADNLRYQAASGEAPTANPDRDADQLDRAGSYLQKAPSVNDALASAVAAVAARSQGQGGFWDGAKSFFRR
jgi:hypothetical protein